MGLEAGTNLGPYEILAPLGAGGMGEVYRARDTRLDRTVAVKVLPEHLSGDPQLQERFEREARAVSALNHPHICTLHDIGRESGVAFMVLEHIEGETLAERLKKGSLPLDRALRHATEIADALDKAHRKGVVHRDLKPGNIMLTKSGAKVLDFGLAKMSLPEAGPVESALPTEGKPLTAEGSILGTLQYMAPEQLEGRDADSRTDVFAFGAVLYEMVTGRRAFEGTSQASLISAIMGKEPQPVSTVQRMSPPPLDRLVARCLAKDPEGRWQSAGDLVHELRWIAGEGGATPAAAREGSIRERRATIAAAVLLVAFLFTLIALLSRDGTATQAAPPVRFSIAPQDGLDLSLVAVGASPLPAVAPDGRRVAFMGIRTSDGLPAIWVWSFDSLTARMLPGTEEAFLSFWSPDSRYLGFFAGQKLKTIDVSGGPPLVLGDAPQWEGFPPSGTWNADGVIVFSTPEGLVQLLASGGEPKPVTRVDPSRGEIAHLFPQFLPDGNQFLYLVRSRQPDDEGIYAGSLDTTEPVRVIGSGMKAEYSAGHLLFLRQRTLLAQPFDPATLELEAEPFPLAEQVGVSVGFGGAAFSASPDGTLAFGPGFVGQPGQLQWFDRSGTPVGLVGQPGVYFDPELSPDGRRVVVERPDPEVGTSDLWLLETTRDATSRFTVDAAFEANAIWSPDGSRLFFRSDASGPFDLYRRSSSGVEGTELIFESGANKYPRDVTSDGRFLVYGDAGGGGGMDLWALPLTGDREPFPLLETDFREDHAQASPDGRWIAYVSNESGRFEVYIQSFPEPGGRSQVSTAGGIAPRWRGDGSELYYIAPDQRLMVVAIGGDTAEVGQPRTLFQTRIFAGGELASTDKQQYDVTPDGERFLVNTPVEGAPMPAPLTIVLNWPGGAPD